ncbi:hypothetical protein DSO57_1037892 [Entomophthora muscae]|uniref:Uncharacterized protein n=2 Tax=Entomophthora muscae TaxID=34485 RepID=A0ACC2SZI0_9FUNG|nr:hypothetical protein DSO57_1036883 [Entomophthora muscae]KAJ9086982.1 hypothetical protein DSO57_1037892 [Entomophthora muscae]
MDTTQRKFIEHLGPVNPNLVVDVCLTAVALLGTVLNLVLLFIACRRRNRQWAIDAFLIAAIGFFDFVVCMSIIVSFAMRCWLGEKVWDTRGAWCKFTAISFSGATVITLGFTACLAVVRYLALVRGRQINTRVWLVTVGIATLVLISLFIERGLNGMLFVLPSGFYCTSQYYGTDWSSIFFGLLNVLILFPSVVAIPVCYIKITLYYSRVIHTMYDIDHSDIVRRLKRNNFCLVLVLVSYSLSIFPEFIHINLSMIFKTQRTALSDGIVMLLLAGMTIVNPTFALLLHDEFRLEFFALIGVVKEHQIPL